MVLTKLLMDEDGDEMGEVWLRAEVRIKSRPASRVLGVASQGLLSMAGSFV
jgi:hypothetical protein